MSNTTPLSVADIDQRLSATDALVTGVLSGSALVGQMPPQPPTVRARVGRLLVSIVRRAVFWLSDQIRSFQTAVVASQKEHAQLLRNHAVEMLRLRQIIEAAEAQMKQLDSTSKRLDSASKQLDSTFRTDLNKLSDRVENVNTLRVESLNTLAENQQTLAENQKTFKDESRSRTDSLRAKHEEVSGQLLRRIQELLTRVERVEKARPWHEDLEHLNQSVEGLKNQGREQQNSRMRKLMLKIK